MGAQPATDFQFFYLLFLPVGVIAVRYGLDGACLALAFTQLALVGLLHRYGYDAYAFTAFQIMMLVLSATGLVVGVVVGDSVVVRGSMRLTRPDGSFAETKLSWTYHFRDGLVDEVGWEPRAGE